MKYSYPPKPLSLHYATLSIILGMVMEIVGIALYSLNNFSGISAVLVGYSIMICTAIGTFKYVIDLEAGKLGKPIFIIIGIFVQVSIMIIMVYFEHANMFFYVAIFLEIIGTALLLYPRTIWWVEEVRRIKNA